MMGKFRIVSEEERPDGNWSGLWLEIEPSANWPSGIPTRMPLSVWLYSRHFREIVKLLRHAYSHGKQHRKPIATWPTTLSHAQKLLTDRGFLVALGEGKLLIQHKNETISLSGLTRSEIFSILQMLLLAHTLGSLA